MPLNVNPPDWAKTMGEYSTYPVSMAFDQQEQANRNNDINQQASLQDILFQAQKQPLELADLRARTGEAGARQKAQETATQLTQQHIDEAIRSGGYKHINDMGAALEQFGTIAKQNGGSLPLQYLSMVPKDMLPLFDMPNGADIALQAGKAIREKSGAWQILGSKQDAAAANVDTKADASRYAADQAAAASRYRSDSAVKRAQIALQGKPTKQDKQSYENYAVKLEQEADNLAMNGEQEKAQYVRQRANEYRTAAQNMRAAGALVNQEIPNKLLFPGGKPPTPQATPANVENAGDPFAGFKIK